MKKLKSMNKITLNKTIQIVIAVVVPFALLSSYGEGLNIFQIIFGTIVLALIFLPVPGWIIYRIVVFLKEKESGKAILPSSYYRTSGGILQALLFLAALISLFLLPLLYITLPFGASNMGSLFWKTYSYCFILLALYVLAATILNSSLLPLKWQLKAFYPVQILLLLAAPLTLFTCLLLPLGVYFLLWLICLSDRKKVEKMDDNFKHEVFSEKDFKQPNLESRKAQEKGTKE